jgi:plastocyanin domain-containing protein
VSTTLNKVSNNVDDIFSPHKGGVYTPARNLATFDGKSSLITIDGKALPTSVRVTTSLNGKSLNSNNLESMDKPKIWINPVLLIGGLLIVMLITKK